MDRTEEIERLRVVLREFKKLLVLGTHMLNGIVLTIEGVEQCVDDVFGPDMEYVDPESK